MPRAIAVATSSRGCTPRASSTTTSTTSATWRRRGGLRASGQRRERRRSRSASIAWRRSASVTGRLEGFAGATPCSRTRSARRGRPTAACCARWRCSTPTSARARRRDRGRPAAGGRDRRRSSRRLDPRARLHRALGHGLPPRTRGSTRPSRLRRARAPAGRHGRPRPLRLGLRFQRTRGSLLGGVGDDAAQIARAIVVRATGALLERAA
jgi:hypothetical protein